MCDFIVINSNLHVYISRRSLQTDSCIGQICSFHAHGRWVPLFNTFFRNKSLNSRPQNLASSIWNRLGVDHECDGRIDGQSEPGARKQNLKLGTKRQG